MTLAVPWPLPRIAGVPGPIPPSWMVPSQVTTSGRSDEGPPSLDPLRWAWGLPQPRRVGPSEPPSRCRCRAGRRLDDLRIEGALGRADRQDDRLGTGPASPQGGLGRPDGLDDHQV